MNYIFTITDHWSAFAAGFSAIMVSWLFGWVIGQVKSLIRFS